MSLIGLITLLTLVSCGGGGGGEDDLSAPQEVVAKSEMVPITFSGNQGTETTVTRADGTPLSDKGIESFQVWGYKNTAVDYSTYQTVFPGYTVSWGANTAYTTTSNTNNWEYVGGDQTIKYWDWGANAYRFFAVTGCDSHEPDEPNKTYKINITADSSPVLVDGKYAKAATDTKLALAPYFSRLWYSTGNPTDYPDKQFGKPVTLEFVKPYARVRFIYNYVYPREGITLSDQSFKPTDGDKKIYRKGVVTVTYPLSGAETKESYSLEHIEATDPENLEAFTEDFDPDDDTKVYNTCDKGWYTVIPNTSQGSYTLTVSINGGTPKTAVVPAEYMQWKPGYNYTYIFKITDAGGVEIGWVEYKVTPWTDMEVSKSVYNW